MKSAIAARPDTLTIVRSRSADYLELIRPRIASMVLFTYLLGAAILGIWFVTCALGFLHIRSVTRARRVLRASLVYLPALLTLLIVEAVFKNWA
jgi:heme O synthase-like polyprenyltransferase